MEIVMLY